LRPSSEGSASTRSAKVAQERPVGHEVTHRGVQAQAHHLDRGVPRWLELLGEVGVLVEVLAVEPRLDDVLRRALVQRSRAAAFALEQRELPVVKADQRGLVAT
jgi:hypothetical protein